MDSPAEGRGSRQAAAEVSKLQGRRGSRWMAVWTGGWLFGCHGQPVEPGGEKSDVWLSRFLMGFVDGVLPQGD